MDIEISVTKKDISTGIEGNDRMCMIAKAVKRTIKDDEVSICENIATIDGVMYNLPKWMRRVIKRFDNGDKVLPFSFKIVDGKIIKTKKSLTKKQGVKQEVSQELKFEPIVEQGIGIGIQKG